MLEKKSVTKPLKWFEAALLIFLSGIHFAYSILPSGKEFGVGRGSLLLQPPGIWGVDSFLLPYRDVKVWLPPGYHDRSNRKRLYPTLYVHDGQNAMEDMTSWTGQSWKLGESLTRLFEQGLIDTPPIVVLISNSVGDMLIPGLRRRHMEYGDAVNPVALAYLSHVSDYLKPRIDNRFRTLQGPEHTAQLGTSLGGQMAFLSLWQRPDVFGGAACLSPAFQTALLTDVALNGARLRSLAQVPQETTLTSPPSLASSMPWEPRVTSTFLPSLAGREPRIYFDNGGDTDDTTVPVFDLDNAAAAMSSLLQGMPVSQALNPGYFWLDTSLQPGCDLMYNALKFHGVPFEFQRFPGGRHNERAWAQRIDSPLLYLYGKKKYPERPFVPWL